MLEAVLSLYALCLVVPWLHRITGGLTGYLIALLPLGLAAYFISLVPATAAGHASLVALDWVPSLGIRFSFLLDGLSILFAILISGIGALVLIYAGSYLSGHPHLGRFYVYILMFMASMLGLVLADNLIALFVFWELTSISSYFLIGFNHQQETARSAALQALLVTGGGGLALLAGFVLLGLAGGSMEISALSGNGESIRSHALYAPMLFLVLAGAFTKSAQVPFHFWLPSAMEAPTPVSAYLHSATMVKAGVYLLARLSPVLGGTELWLYTVSAAGATTMICGAFLALRQTDLKRILAYLTVSALGILVLFLGLGTSEAILAAIVFLVAHALYKGALFLVAGIIDHETGTRDVEKLGGLRLAMPITAVAAILAGLSLAAWPPALGFIGKELLLEATLTFGAGAPGPALLSVALVLASIVFVAAAGIVVIQPFFGKAIESFRHSPGDPLGLWPAPALLALLGVLFGVAPGIIEDSVFQPAVEAIVREPMSSHLALWHGLNLPLALSVISSLGGALIYVARKQVFRALARLQIAAWWGPRHWYDGLLGGMNRVAQLQTRVLQNGYLRFYLLIVVATTLGLAAKTLFGAAGSLTFTANFDARFHEWIVAALIPIGALTAILSRSRLSAVAALGVVGYSVALIFVLFGAPDLAMTQFMVETLTVILFVLVFYHLPRFADLSGRLTVVRDAVMALGFGALITIIVSIGSGIQFYPKISEYFIDNSLPLAHGRNIVNTILVDFRGFDTFGEITVLAVAGTGVYALLRLKPRKERRE